MKKFISLLLVCAMLIAATPVIQAAEAPTWEGRFDYLGGGYYYDGWAFRPYKDIVVRQNSPDFSWPRIPEATSYDLIVCADENLSEIKYERKNLKLNVYNFPYTFDVGEYWWAVRFTTDDGISEWTEASKFFVPKDAYIYTLPEMEDVVSQIPESHPRLGVTQETLEEFRTYKNTSKEAKLYYENLVDTVKNDMATEIPKEPFNVSDADAE